MAERFVAEAWVRARYLFSTNHRIVGIQFLVLSMAMALCGGVFMALMRMNLAWPGVKWPFAGRNLPHAMQSGIMKPEFYLALMTMHGTIMVFFVISLALVSGSENFIIRCKRSSRNGIPSSEHALVLDRGDGVRCAIASICRGGRRACFRMDVVSAAERGAQRSTGGRTGDRRCGRGHGAVHRVLHHGRGQLHSPPSWRSAQRHVAVPHAAADVELSGSSALGVLTFPALFAAVTLLLCDRHFGTSFYLPSGLFFGKRLLANEAARRCCGSTCFWFLGHPKSTCSRCPPGPWCSTSSRVHAQAGIRLSGDGPLLLCDRGAQPHRLGTSHVRQRDEPVRGRVLCDRESCDHVPSTMIGGQASRACGRVRSGSACRCGSRLRPSDDVRHRRFRRHVPGNATSDIQLHDTYFVWDTSPADRGMTLMATFAALHYWFPKMYGA